MRPVLKVDYLEKLSCLLLCLGLRYSCKFEREADVPDSISLHQQVELLEDHRYLAALEVELFALETCEDIAVEYDLATGFGGTKTEGMKASEETGDGK